MTCAAGIVIFADLDERGPPPRQAAVSALRAGDYRSLHPHRAPKVLGLAAVAVLEHGRVGGHRVEGIPVPGADARWRLIVVEGEAS